MLFSVFQLFLPIFAILGFSSLFAALLQTNLSQCLIMATSFVGVLEFLFAVTKTLPEGTAVLLYSGVFLFIYFGARQSSLHFTKSSKSFYWKTIQYFLIYSSCIAFYSWGLRFRSIDDYSFWGVISKYLFVFNQLPRNNQFITDNFLMYIPGMASYHYLFYYAAGKYSQFIGYFAQGSMLLSALMILFDARNVRLSLYRMAIAYILLSIGFGTIFARMEVDAYVASFVFAIFWFLLKKKLYHNAKYLILFPILFLSLIKEIGLLFSLMSITAFLIKAREEKWVSIYALFILAGVLGLRWIWVIHCHQYGFHSFAHAVDLPHTLSALNPFNSYYHLAQTLFLKAVLFEKFGHILSWPNVASYIALALIWHSLVKTMKEDEYRSAAQLKWVYLCTMMIYLVMLYLLQAIVFNVGHAFYRLLDFQRYFNMLLIPFTLFTVLIYFEEKRLSLHLTPKHPLAISIMAIASLFFVSGKIERSYRYYLPHLINPLVRAVSKELPKEKRWTLCLNNPPKPNYQISMPLAYFFLPNKIITLSEFPPPSDCDYVMHWPDNNNPTQVTFENYRKLI